MPQRPPFAAYNIGYDAVSWLEQELEPIMSSVQEAEVGEPGDEQLANKMRRSKVAWCQNDNVRNFLIRNFSTAIDTSLDMISEMCMIYNIQSMMQNMKATMIGTLTVPQMAQTLGMNES